MEKRKIILDCDPGHDDAIAMMMAAKHPAIDLLGITIVAGNQTLDKIGSQRKKSRAFVGENRSIFPPAR